MGRIENYASMMDLDKSIVKDFLVGMGNVPEEQIINELLELKAVIGPLDPKAARDIIASKSGDQKGTIHCLQQLQDTHAINEGPNCHKKKNPEKSKEKGLFGWFFGKKSKQGSAKSSEASSDEKKQEELTHSPQVAEIPSKPSTSSPEVVPSPETVQKSPVTILLRQTGMRYPEEEQVAREYDFTRHANNTAYSSEMEPGEEFRIIYNQFLRTASKS
ncbi:hypothetical protein DQ04_04791090 [Trypanosoma grayi]|uniref:hypothetical protein n=1 Tax=Trypanosoma grayi TaxID=71804 RepID=UPI0004F44BBD|nr:hypothetical protein DQ04_04791090 [Trypanosoma grayi]KEG09706.1 hypothetical protein DQ04_04791090 [Trypanosoma grayi]